MPTTLHKVIGIDLGTTYSAVATLNTLTGQAEILLNRAEADAPTVPSVVSMDPILRKAIVGLAAKRNLSNDPANTVVEIKREMGEVFRPHTLEKLRGQLQVWRNAGLITESAWQEAMRFQAFPPSEADQSDPVKAHFAGQWFLPQEISALILMKMKEIAQKEIGEEILDAVITVPAYFSEIQKKATKEAALLAGLYPRQLIPEPTAAAICYGVDQYVEETFIYLVYDLGGGTFDVSIIEVKGEEINVIATSGDPRLGGGDFDDAITNWAIEKLMKEHAVDVSANPSVKARIKLLAETAKINLSAHSETTINLAELNPQNPPVLRLTREEFLGLIDGILRKSLTYVDRAINSAEKQKAITRDQINAILLVGGSTKIPRVKDMLLKAFNKDESFVKSDLNPDEVVARGAAVMAKRFAPTPPPFDIKRKEESTLVNLNAQDDIKVALITEHSLGVAAAVGNEENIMSRIIDQGTGIPVEIRQGGYTNNGPSQFIPVRIYQGEKKYVYENTLIGTLQIGPMEPKPAHFHQFDVTFKLDVNGLLTVTVHHLNENKNYPAIFEHKSGVGGDDALQVKHLKLTQLFAHSAAVLPQQQPAQSPVPPPPPPPAAVPPSQPAAAQTAPEPVATAVAPAAAQSVAAAIPDAPAVPVSSTAAVAGMIEPTVEVPAQFKQVLRRAKKQLIAKMNPELLAAFNFFVAALNSGKTESDLEEFGDQLADAFEKARD